MLQDKSENDKLEIEDVKLIYDFKYNAIKEASLGLFKGVSFYLAITAVLVGYILTQEVDRDIKNQGTLIGVLVSILALVCGWSMSWGIIKGLNSLESLMQNNNSKLFLEFEVNSFFNRFRIIIIIAMICFSGVALIFSIALLFMKK